VTAEAGFKCVNTSSHFVYPQMSVYRPRMTRFFARGVSFWNLSYGIANLMPWPRVRLVLYTTRQLIGGIASFHFRPSQFVTDSAECMRKRAMVDAHLASGTSHLLVPLSRRLREPMQKRCRRQSDHAVP